MLNGVKENYVKILDQHTVKLPCETSTWLFINLCEAIDINRGQAYRYGYEPRRLGKNKGYQVVVQDIGI